MSFITVDLRVRHADTAVETSAGPPATQRFLLVLSLLLPLAFLLIVVPYWWNVSGFGDVHFYAEAARRIRAGEAIYEPLPQPGPLGFSSDWLLYVYPPFLAAALALLPPVPLDTLGRAFFAMNLVCFGVFAACLAALAQRRITFRGTLVAATVILLTPGGLWSLLHRNINPLLWALIGIALVVPAARGVALASGTLLKLFPAWPLLFALMRERRPVMLGAALAVAVGCGIAVITMGGHGFVSETMTWTRYILPALSQGQFDVGGGPTPFVAWLLHGNWSPAFAPLALARQLGWAYEGGELPALARAYLTIVGAAAPILAGWWTRRQSPEVQYGAVVCAALAFAPILRPSYIPVLLIAPALLIRSRAATSSVSAVRPGARERISGPAADPRPQPAR